MLGRARIEAAYVVALLHAILLSSHCNAVNPESCVRSEHVTRGDYVQWHEDNSSDSPPVECQYKKATENERLFAEPVTDQIGTTVAFLESGVHTYWCSADNSGEITVVEASHTIALCEGCSGTDLLVHPGEVVYWNIGSYDLMYQNCTVQLVNLNCSTLVREFDPTEQGSEEGYLFEEEGLYQLLCAGNCTPIATITVLEAGVTNNTEAIEELYSQILNSSTCPTEAPATEPVLSELIYSHAGVMAVTFGILLPLGALVANFQRKIVHIVVQIVGILLAVVGLSLSIAYTELNNGVHFCRVHAVVGLAIVIATLLFQPVLKLLVVTPLRDKWKGYSRIWHKRLGVCIVFFGMFNVFLGIVTLSGIPSYIGIIYGVYVVIAVFVYVSMGAFRSGQHYQMEEHQAKDNRNGVKFTSCFSSSKRTTEMISLRQDSNASHPMKLSRDILSEEKYVQIRKKSMDMLDMEVKPLPDNSKGMVPLPRRKISNVHFGPVAFNPQTPDTPAQNESYFNYSSPPPSAEESSPYNNQSEESDRETTDCCESLDSPTHPNTTDQEQSDTENTNPVRFSVGSLPSPNGSPGGSLRITRHSSRAHTKVSEIFQRSNSMCNPNRIPPTITTTPVQTEVSPLIHSVSKPLGCPRSDQEKDELSPEPSVNETMSQMSDSLTCPVQPVTPVKSPIYERRRKQVIGLEPPNTNDLIVSPTRQRRILRSPSVNRNNKDQLLNSTLQSVMQLSQDAIVCANAQGEVVFWSPGAVKMFGYTQGEAVGSSLQMIMPHRYREKHQNGVNGRTERAMEYISKHHTAPLEHKHARLYAVDGISKTGKEFPVEVVVTSFVIEGEMFYTGIITEMPVKGALTRNQSLSALSTEAEIREKHQKAMSIGVQMKVAHKLRSTEHISKRELRTILESSLKATDFEVVQQDLDAMVDGIMKAGDPESTSVLKFVDLIDLLAKHRLYISDSGLIAKYGKTKGTEVTLNSRRGSGAKIVEFFASRLVSLSWLALYLILNVVLLVVGVFSTERSGWNQWAYGTGPVLSMNCVLALLPILHSFVHLMRASPWLNKVLPLTRVRIFHLTIVGGITFWTLVHLFTHFCSFALDKEENSTLTNAENFRENFIANYFPAITGFVIIVIFLVLFISAIPVIRKMCRFIGFHVTHWTALIFFYLLLIVHGVTYCNPSFWKWLLPVALLLVAEKIYARFIAKRYTAKVTMAAPYVELCRVSAISIKVDRPAHFCFTPGQYIRINVPDIGFFNWQTATISSSPNEKKLLLYLPHAGNLLLTQLFKAVKVRPLKETSPSDAGKVPVPLTTPAILNNISITGPYGKGADDLFDYKVAVLVCGGEGPHACRSIIQKYLEYRRSSCRCGCHPKLNKLYFVWVTPSGNDYEWFTDFLSELVEDEHMQRYLDIRIFLTNINSPPDELASALLHLGLKTADGQALSIRRSSQPQLSKLFSNTSYGVPDFESLLDFVSMQHGTSTDTQAECGVFTIGQLSHVMYTDLAHHCRQCSGKKGPSVAAADMMAAASQYRKRSLSSSVSSPEPEEAKEWHINFVLNRLYM